MNPDHRIRWRLFPDDFTVGQLKAICAEGTEHATCQCGQPIHRIGEDDLDWTHVDNPSYPGCRAAFWDDSFPKHWRAKPNNERTAK